MRNLSPEDDDVEEIVRDIFLKVEILKTKQPEYTWENLLGDYGEYLAIKRFDLEKAPSVNKDYDAIDSDGRTVQIKTYKTGTNVKFKDGKADLMLVISVKRDGTFSTVFFGEFQKVKDASTFSRYSNRYVISISKLKALKS